MRSGKRVLHVAGQPRLLRTEQRGRLELATAAYFAGLTPEALWEESGLEVALDQSASEIDFDRY